MSDVEAVAAALGAAVASLEQAEQATQEATEGFGESALWLGRAIGGTGDLEIGISAYLAEIGMSATPTSIEVTGLTREDGAHSLPGVHTTTTLEKPVPVSQDRVGELKRDLPPRVDRGEGQKTHGLWVTGSDAEEAGRIVSGRDDMETAAVQFFKDQGARRMPSTTADVEVKLAVHMQNNGITSATVAVNNEVCKGPFGCETLVPKILPQGSALTVYGTTPDGTPVGTTYLGQRKKP